MELLRRLEDRARERLPEAVYDYFAGGAGDERSLAANADAWQRLWLRPRHMTGVGEADTSVELLGSTLAAPVVLAPAAAQRLLHPEGEVAAARAAAAAGVGYALSTRSTADLAEVAGGVPEGATLWFQLYVHSDRDAVARMLRRAREHGYRQIVLTIDVPVAGRRERQLVHPDVELPDGVTIANHLGEASEVRIKPPTGGWVALRWEDVAWVREASGLDVLVKGVLTAEDAREAVARGASAIVVSDHGARQLDGTVPTAVALREVAAAVGGAVPLLVDGGIRSGADIVRALACGADAVLIGRPYLWGLACDGEAGVTSVIDALKEDLARTLVLVGAASCAGVRPEHVVPQAWLSRKTSGRCGNNACGRGRNVPPSRVLGSAEEFSRHLRNRFAEKHATSGNRRCTPCRACGYVAPSRRERGSRHGVERGFWRTWRRGVQRVARCPVTSAISVATCCVRSRWRSPARPSAPTLPRV